MAKAKAKDVDKLEVASDKTYIKDIIKKFGNVMRSVDDILDEERQIFSVTPRLDIALGGGIIDGSWWSMSGHEKIGKTTHALQFCATMQKPENGSRHIFYGDVEERLKKRDILGIHGLDYSTKMFTHIASEEDAVLSGEDHLTIYDHILKHEKRAVLVIDSLGALSSKAEMDGTMSDQQRGDVAKLIAKFIRRNKSYVRVNNHVVLLINQLIGNASGMGAEFKDTGGKKAGYVVDARLRGKGVEKWKEKDKQIGQKVTWEIMTSGISGTGTQIDTYLRYGYGIDIEAEIVDLAVDNDIIKLSGTWYTYKDARFQGGHKMANFLRENPDIANEIYAQIRELYGI